MFAYIFQMSLVFILSGLIGLERQKRQRLAGMRTNVLVALGAFLFVTFSMRIEGDSSTTRMAAQVVSGIGFLGAGVIMRDGLNVKGLNTAATLWCSAAIGVLISAGFVLEAFIGTIYILFANIYLRKFITFFNNHYVNMTDFEVSYQLLVKCELHAKFHIRALMLHMLQSEDLALTKLTSEETQSGHSLIEARVTSLGKRNTTLEKLTSRIGIEEGVASISWEIDACTEL